MFFWNSLAFSVVQWMLAIWSLVPLPFLNTHCIMLFIPIISVVMFHLSFLIIVIWVFSDFPLSTYLKVRRFYWSFQRTSVFGFSPPLISLSSKSPNMELGKKWWQPVFPWGEILALDPELQPRGFELPTCWSGSRIRELLLLRFSKFFF